jgi:ABC-type transporter Mla subunit MlaD
MNTTLRQALSQTKPDFTRELDNLKQMSDSLDNLKTQRGLDVSNLQAKIGQLKAQLSSNKVDAVNKVMAAQENFNNLKAEYRMATLKGKQSDLSRTRLAYGAAATGVVGGGAGALLKALLHK